MGTQTQKMITAVERFYLITSKGVIGYDCYGKKIMAGDQVEVVKESRHMKDNPDYQYCAKGEQGKALKNQGHWMILVEFQTENGEPATVSCTDYDMRKIE